MTSTSAHGGVLAALRGLRRGEVSPTDLTLAALEAAGRHAEHNAMAALLADAALERAAELSAAREPVGLLHGVPVSVKDLFAVRGVTMRAGCRAQVPPLAGTQAGEAVVVARLRAAGAVLLGTTNMVEIAMGINGENALTGDVRNAHDPARQAGGSSSGSAVAVALGIGLASVGTDTAGSIRIPASFNGVVGFKPTYGAVPLGGVLPLAVTCDHGGPLTRSVADARLMFSVLAARDLPSQPVSGPRLGVPWRFLDGRLTAGVREGFHALLDRFRDGGATLVEVDLPDADPMLDVYGPLSRPEAAHVHRAALDADPDLFAPFVRDSLLAGRRYPAVEYLAAREVRRAARRRLDDVLAGVDAVALPSAPMPAPPLGTTEVELESGTTSHRSAFLPLSLPFSFTGVPAVSLPVPLLEQDGLPVGLQLVGAAGQDAALLNLATWAETVAG